ncbi:MAG: aldo/keto reductase, partial [bacterium]
MEDPFETGEVPSIGIGTWMIDDIEQCADTVEKALNIGYRHVDTAQIYENEQGVGNAIARTNVDRDQLFVATKIWNSNLDYEGVISTARESLERLQLEYVDLLYIHWPAENYDPQQTIRAFEELYQDGLIKRFGVSNFLLEQIKEVRQISEIPV